MRHIPPRRSRGTATVELAILLPAYLIVLFGVLYIGWATLAAVKQQSAAAYVALQPGNQAAADILPVFFPWAGAVQTTGGAPNGGTQAVAGDVTLRVNDALTTSDAFPQRSIDEALWTLALGEFTVQTVVPFGGGQAHADLVEHLDEAAQYLRANEITTIPAAGGPSGTVRQTGAGGTMLTDRLSVPAAGSTVYTEGVARALNASTLPGNWLERRDAALEYEYAPYYIHRIGAVAPPSGGSGVQNFSRRQYLYAEPADQGVVRAWPGACHSAARGDALRLGARDTGMSSDLMLQQMRDLLDTAGPLAIPLSDERPYLQTDWTPR